LRFAQVFKAGETKGPLSQPGNLNADRFLNRRRIERAITLHGDGLFVVDPTSTPMEILAEYMGRRSTPMASEVSKRTAMYTNSGAGAADTNPSQFDVYRFPLSDL
jgi:hypothetical protein